MLLERKFNREKAPIYKKRAAVIANIPFFWLQCFVNHDGLRSVLDDDDISILKLMTTFDVSDLKEPAVGYTITMAFKPNPFFKNQTISKTYTIEKPAETAAAAKAAEDEDEDDPATNGNVKVSCTKIEWKDETFVERNPSSFFVQWFDSEAVAEDNSEDALADAFRGMCSCHSPHSHPTTSHHNTVQTVEMMIRDTLLVPDHSALCPRVSLTVFSFLTHH